MVLTEAVMMSKLCIICKSIRPVFFNIFTSEEKPLLDKRLSRILSINLALYKGQTLVVCDECVCHLEKIEVLELLKAEFLAKFRRKVIDQNEINANPVPLTSYKVSPTHSNNTHATDSLPLLTKTEATENSDETKILSNYEDTKQNSPKHCLRSSKKYGEPLVEEQNVELLTSNTILNCRSRLKKLLISRSEISPTRDDDDILDCNFSDISEDTTQICTETIESSIPSEKLINVKCDVNCNKKTDTKEKEMFDAGTNFPLGEIPLETLNKILIIPSSENVTMNTNSSNPNHSVTISNVPDSSKAVSYDLNILMQDAHLADNCPSNYHCKPVGELRLKITKDSLQSFYENDERNLELNPVEMIHLDEESSSSTSFYEGVGTDDRKRSNIEIKKYSENSWKHISSSKENFPVHMKIREYLEKCGSGLLSNSEFMEQDVLSKDNRSCISTDTNISHTDEVPSINENESQKSNETFYQKDKILLPNSAPIFNQLSENRTFQESHYSVKRTWQSTNSSNLQSPVSEHSTNDLNVSLASALATVSSNDPFEFTDTDSFSVGKNESFSYDSKNCDKGENTNNAIHGNKIRNEKIIPCYIKNGCKHYSENRDAIHRKRGRKRRYNNVMTHCKLHKIGFTKKLNESLRKSDCCLALSSNKELETQDIHAVKTLKNVEVLNPKEIKQEKPDEQHPSNLIIECNNDNANDIHKFWSLPNGSENNQRDHRLLLPHEIKSEVISGTGNAHVNNELFDLEAPANSTLIIEPQKNYLTTLRINEKGATMIYYKEESEKHNYKSCNDLLQDPIGVVLFHLGLCRDQFEGILLCGSCTQPAMFTEFASYEMHLNICHQRCLLYSCSKCGVRSKSAFAAESHLIQSHKILEHTSSVNKKDNSSTVSLAKNKCLTHLSNEIYSSKQLTEDSEASQFMCGVCNTIFSTHKECFAHMDMHSAPSEFLCDKCPLSFPSLELLKGHEITFHNNSIDL